MKCRRRGQSKFQHLGGSLLILVWTGMTLGDLFIGLSEAKWGAVLICPPACVGLASAGENVASSAFPLQGFDGCASFPHHIDHVPSIHSLGTLPFR